MIIKNQQYGISQNVTIADFGLGDIIVADGYVLETKQGSLLLANDQPGDIGRDHEDRKGKSTDEFTQDIIFTFANTESVDVIIEALQRVKVQINKQYNP